MSRSGVATFGLLALIAASGVVWLGLSSSEDLGPIVYSSSGQLCSIDIQKDGKPSCYGSSLRHLSFSPDGRLLAAYTTPSNPIPSRIAILDRSGARLGYLPGSDDFIRPVWSPDGNYVYAVINALGHASVGRWRWPSGEKALVPVENLPSGCRGINSLSLSSAGDRAVLLCDFRQLYLAEVRSDLLRVERELAPQFSYVSSPTWFDKSHLLAVARMKKGEIANLWRIDSATGFAEIVPTPGLALQDYVTVSPDGKSVVVTGSRQTTPLVWRWGLWRIDLDDQKQTQLTGGTEDVAAAWTR
jgi:Tol biopolymer transport system component